MRRVGAVAGHVAGIVGAAHGRLYSGLVGLTASQQGDEVAIALRSADSVRLATPKRLLTGLTTHVLDTMHGQPAAGVAVRLLRAGEAVAVAVTNADGRCDGPLLTGEALTVGTYSLEFDVGRPISAGWASPCPTRLSWRR